MQLTWFYIALLSLDRRASFTLSGLVFGVLMLVTLLSPGCCVPAPGLGFAGRASPECLSQPLLPLLPWELVVIELGMRVEAAALPVANTTPGWERCWAQKGPSTVPSLDRRPWWWTQQAGASLSLWWGLEVCLLPQPFCTTETLLLTLTAQFCSPYSYPLAPNWTCRVREYYQSW